MKGTISLKAIYIYLLFAICLGMPESIFSQSAEKVVKKESAFKKDIKKIEKDLSFKNFKHHPDSARLAKRYIHREHALARKNDNYAFIIDTSTAQNEGMPYKPNTAFNLEQEVFAWYPFWEKELYKTLNYSLLSTVAYFSYEVNPKTGYPQSTSGWNEATPLIDSLKAHNKNILLTVTNFTNQSNRKFLRNNIAINTLITNLKNLLKNRGNGICIDFEGVEKSDINNYSNFISLLSQELKKENKGYLLYVTVPAVNWEKSLDFQSLIPAVDQFVIMGYDYYGKGSTVAGPVSPLQSGKLWDPFNIYTSVDYYLANKIPPSKLILALPFYGDIWSTENGDKGAKAISYLGSRSYDYIKANIKEPIQYDTVSKSVWQAYATNNNGSQFRQCWFENDSTLSVKLKYIKEKKLKGVGIWALGYDKSSNDLWKAIAENLTTNGTSLPKDITAGKSGFIPVLNSIGASFESISNFRGVAIFIMILVVLFGGIGFVIAMFQPDTRMYFFNTSGAKIFYLTTILLFLIIVFRLNNVIDNFSVMLIIGFVAGGISVFFVNRIIERKRRNLP